MSLELKRTNQINSIIGDGYRKTRELRTLKN